MRVQEKNFAALKYPHVRVCLFRALGGMMKAKSHSARLRCTNVNWISWSKDRVDHSAPHHAVRTGDRARACLDYSTFQTSISDRRSVCFCHASLVSVNHGHCFGACTGAGYFPVAGRPPLVAPGSPGGDSSAAVGGDLAGATESFRVDVSSTSERCVCKT